MKQVIPFKKDIIFKTKISDITSISLEHTLSVDHDSVSGDFILSGDYKMTEASVNKENFYYKLPFDIALDSRYDTSKLKIEIEDFYYEIINSDVLRVNIEVSVDGLEEKEIESDENILNEEKNDKEPTILDIDDDAFQNLEDKIDSLQEELVRNHEHINNFDKHIFEEINDTENEIKMPEAEIIEEDKNDKEEIIDEQQEYQTPKPIVGPPIIGKPQSEEMNMKEKDEKININTQEIKSLFSNLNEEETFSTYHVYIMRSEDTLESVMAKYSVTKDTLAKYNDVENIKLGDKIIIPALIND